MNSKLTVSVIIPFLNTGKFIREAIESVFAQTYDDWELLLVDDGSTDGSTAITRYYADQYPARVSYLEHEGHQNRGTCASRNLGIRKANGKYIALLDADDVWLPHKLKQQVEILDSHPEAGMVYGLSQYWYSWTENPEGNQSDYVEELGVQPNTVFKPPRLFIRCYPLGEAAAPCPSDLLLRREMVEHIGGFEEEFRGIYQLYEDQVFLTKVYLNASVFAASECWDKHRLHPDSCEAVATKAGHYDSVRLVFLNWLEKYLTEQGVKDPKVWHALQKALWSYRHPIFYHLSKRTKSLMTQMKEIVKLTAQRTLPAPILHWLKAQWRGHEYRPPVGWVRFGNLRRLTPISPDWGFDRGSPVDRYYVEKFLSGQAQQDIRGHTLEIEDNTYTHQFGGDRVTKSDVLHVKEGNPNATIVADLTCAEQIPSNTFDCIVLTQTLQLVYDLRSAVKTLYRILKPGGVVLATVPGITQISHYQPEQASDTWAHDTDNWSNCWCWSFTTLSAKRLFEDAFSPENVAVESYGNVLAATAMLHGLAAQELHQTELDYRDPDYQVIITVRAKKPEVTG